MHGSEVPAHELFWGLDDGNLYVRLDGAGAMQFGIEFDTGPAQVEHARGRVVEMRARRAGKKFRVTAARKGLPSVTLPPDGWIEIE